VKQTSKQKLKLKLLPKLFLSFCKVGLFTFGGGLSMLPMLEREMVARRKWCTKAEILDYYAVGQCTPGIIAVDVSSFIGYRVCGVAGAVAGPFAVMLPGFLLMLLMATVLRGVAEIQLVQSAFVGIRVAVCALITASVVHIVRESVGRWWQIVLLVSSFALVAILGINPAWVVVGAGVLGLFGSFRSAPKDGAQP
jgi:chromate transporter